MSVHTEVSIWQIEQLQASNNSSLEAAKNWWVWINKRMVTSVISFRSNVKPDMDIHKNFMFFFNKECKKKVKLELSQPQLSWHYCFYSNLITSKTKIIWKEKYQLRPTQFEQHYQGFRGLHFPDIFLWQWQQKKQEEEVSGGGNRNIKTASLIIIGQSYTYFWLPTFHTTSAGQYRSFTIMWKNDHQH